MNFQQNYQKNILPKLQADLGIGNIMAVPTISKITLNVGLGRGVGDSAFEETVEKTLTNISGQKPVKTHAKQSISNFKIRKGQVIGMKVTIRGKRMFDFIEKLVNITLPRVRDFRGLSIKSIDKLGNLNLGIKEHIAFPEVKAEEVDKIHGLEVTITTKNSRSKEDGLALFSALGFPFIKK